MLYQYFDPIVQLWLRYVGMSLLTSSEGMVGWNRGTLLLDNVNQLNKSGSFWYLYTGFNNRDSREKREGNSSHDSSSLAC